MSSTPEAALEKVFELAARVADVMSGALTDRGLTPARAEVLFVLHQHGRPMVQRELSQALRCTPRHVTALVDALQQHGTVRRDPHPTDRRATLVALTDAGAATAGWMDDARRAAARAILGDVPARDLASFVTVADRILDRLATGDGGAG